LFVADSLNHRILVFDLASGVTTFMPATNVLGQPDFSTGFVNDSTRGANRACGGGAAGSVNQCGLDIPGQTFLDAGTERLYVTDAFNNRIVVFDIANGIVDGMPAAHVFGQDDFFSNDINNDCRFVSSSSGPVNRCGLNFPFGFTGDPAQQRFFAVDTFNNRVLELSRVARALSFD
jgi:DNA-binding beta-propeller fold protein YncE